MKKLLLIVIGLSLLSCEKEKETEVQDVDATRARVIVLNEGNFRSSNASIDIYFPDNHNFLEGVFASNNQNRPLGDIAQSMEVINGELWVVLNNSNKIEILDPTNFSSKGKMEGFNSPRYILPINSNKAYVSDLFEGKIYVIDPSARTITKTLNSGSWSEEMLLLGNKALVCMPSDNQVVVWDTDADTVFKTIATARSPHALELDSRGKIWIAYSGGYNELNPGLHRLNPDSLGIEVSMELNDNSKSIGDIAMNKKKDQLYYILDDLYSIDIEDSLLATNPLIAANGRNFYALDIDPISGDLYIADPIDYQQKGSIYRYSESGTLIHQFKGGLIPGFFYFLK